MRKAKDYGWCVECSGTTYYRCDSCRAYCCLRCQEKHVCKQGKVGRWKVDATTIIMLVGIAIGFGCIILGTLLMARDEQRERQWKRKGEAMITQFANGSEDEYSFAAFWRTMEQAYGTMTRDEATDLYALRDSIIGFADVSILLSYREAVRAGLSPEQVC